MNRFSHQFARDGHLTFRKKCRDLVIQIFGHEGLYDEAQIADVGVCPTFGIDIYRLNDWKFANLAWRKLVNPFKWLEFLITAPLELLAWAPARFVGHVNNTTKIEGKNRKGFIDFLILLIYLTELSPFYIMQRA